MPHEDLWYRSNRFSGLLRFAIAITLLNVLGHTVLGFEQSYALPLVALVTGYTVELLIEWIGALVNRRPPRFAGGTRHLLPFLLSAHISSLAISMLVYPNDRLMPIVFAVTAALGSKAIFRFAVSPGTSRHFMNPSNFGIALTLLVFPWVGIAPPYHFTENLGTWGDWMLPGLIICSGTFLNLRYTKRGPLLIAWIAGFALQALVRSVLLGDSLLAGLMPMTGMAFLLFTFYMVTDPPTTPNRVSRQILFGGGVAAAYGMLLTFHIVFGLFFGLAIVCSIRGVFLLVTSREPAGAEAPSSAPTSTTPVSVDASVAMRSAEG